jgi:flavodoxin
MVSAMLSLGPGVPTMPFAKTLVLCTSVHHRNTARVAAAMADVLHAVVAAPETFPDTSLDEYDLVGFGSGVYYGRFHEALRNWVHGLPDQTLGLKPAFVFSTSGLPCLWRFWHGSFTHQLRRKGFEVVGEFHCRGFDSWGPLRLGGGINRRHPNERDLARAAAFARAMQRTIDARLDSPIRLTVAARVAVVQTALQDRQRGAR